jgi:hypothetical protein
LPPSAPLEQPAFERGVHVLVRDRRPERSVRAGPVQVVERLEHRAELVVSQQAGLVQHARVRTRRTQVVPG